MQGNTNQNFRRCDKNKKVMLEYTTPYTPQMNDIKERIFAIIKEGSLETLQNEKPNIMAQKILRVKAVHM